MITIHRTTTTILFIFSCSLLCCNRYHDTQFNMTGEDPTMAQRNTATSSGQNNKSVSVLAKLQNSYRRNEAYPKINDEEGPKLIQAASRNIFDDVVYFAKMKPKSNPINGQDRYGYTALHYAVSNGNLAMASFLLENGANLEVENRYKWTPLLEAVLHNGLDVMSLLLEKGANLEVRDRDDYTPLLRAAYNNNLDMVSLLLEKGANPIVQNNDEKTPVLLTTDSNVEAYIEGYLMAKEEAKQWGHW